MTNGTRLTHLAARRRCSVALLEKLLGAEMETFTAAKEDLVCKLLIKERKEGYL
jgi:hypothetical protein